MGDCQIGHLFLFASHIIRYPNFHSILATCNNWRWMQNMRWWVWERKTLEQISSDDIYYRLKVAGTHFSILSTSCFWTRHGSLPSCPTSCFWTRHGSLPSRPTSCFFRVPEAARCLASDLEFRILWTRCGVYSRVHLHTILFLDSARVTTIESASILILGESRFLVPTSFSGSQPWWPTGYNSVPKWTPALDTRKTVPSRLEAWVPGSH